MENFIRLNKAERSNFLENDNDGQIIKMMTDEGIQILDKSENKLDILNYILSMSKYINELYQNENFLKLILKLNKDILFYQFERLNDNTLTYLVNYVLNTNEENIIIKIFEHLPVKFQCEYIKNTNLNMEILNKIINSISLEATNIIINKLTSLSQLEIDYIRLCEKIEEENMSNTNSFMINAKLTINPNLFDNKTLNDIWNKYNIFELRKIIDTLSYCLDTTNINNFILKKEKETIKEIKENGLIEPLNKLYETTNIKDNKEKYDIDINSVIKLYPKYKIDINQIDLDDEKNGTCYYDLLNYINKTISNYIIDYHFNDIYYNVVADITELLNFYYQENINIEKNILQLYLKILNIDKLTAEAKLELFEQLNNINIKEIFYDHITKAKQIRNESIIKSTLTKENIKKYYNKNFSKKFNTKIYQLTRKKFNTKIYQLKGENFYAIVKSSNNTNDTNYETISKSFSLIGSQALETYDIGTKFIYDVSKLDINQILHVYPADSFASYYKLGNYRKPTNKINKLYVADELVKNTLSYNEILLLDKGYTEDEINKNFNHMEIIAIYCKDEITNEDLEMSKEMNLPIMLVHSKYYETNKDKENCISMHDHSTKNSYYNDDSLQAFEYERNKKR